MSNKKVTKEVKLRIGVKMHEGVKLFFVEGCRKLKVYFDSIDAVYFEGYNHRDKILAIRGGKVLFEGSVIIQGKVEAELFLNFVEADTAVRVTPDQFEEGDIIKVQTVAHTSANSFAKYLISFYGLHKDMDSAFSKNNGRLDGTQLIETLALSEADSVSKIETQKLFVLTS